MKIAVFFASGMEELEALTPVDVLRRAAALVTTISISDELSVIGSHGIKIFADTVIDKTDVEAFDAYVLPGGMPGATNLSNTPKLISALKNAVKDKKLVSAICASPAVVLAKHGLIKDHKATCYPAPEFVNALGSSYLNEDVVLSNNIITANGPKSAFKFSLEICKYLNLVPKF